MSITANSGPYIAFGQSPYGLDYNPDLGPSLFYGGVARLDPRTNFTYLPGQASASLTAGFATSDTMTINYAPYAKGTAAIAAAANVVSGTPMT